MQDKFSEGNLSVNIDNNQNRSALLGEQSPSNRLNDMSGIERNSQGNLDNQSLGGSAYAPPQKYYKTEGQAKLDHFMERLKQESGSSDANLRSSSKAQVADDSENSDEEVRNQKQNLDQSFAEKIGFKHNAPLDPSGCSQIQTLSEYVEEVTECQKNPKQQFFDLSRTYYTAKYDKDNKKEINVRSYIITEDNQNFVKDLSMDILQTNQGCLPIIKTFEWNAYSKHKFVKALKFYNYRGDCKLSKQFVVDDGVMHNNFYNYDVSLLHFGNTILFYKREENWHKLMMYDVLTKQENELEGYQIAEPVGDEALRYHIMFSQEFGVKKTKMEKGQIKNVHDFLKTKFVFAQTYRVNESAADGQGMKYNYYNVSLAMWSLEDTSSQLIQYQYVTNGGDVDPTYKKYGFNMNEEAVQWVGHMQDPQNKRILFIATDPFRTHQFEYRPYIKFNNTGSIEFTNINTFLGNNELQNMNRELVLNQSGEIQKRIQQDEYDKHTEIDTYCTTYNLPNPAKEKGVVVKDKQLQQLMLELNQANTISEKQWKMNNLSPFLIHQNPQFLIQKETIQIADIYQGKKTIEQYFYITHDNQFMLIHPNYEDQKEKTKVVLEIAKKLRQHQMADDIDFDVLTDEEILKLYNDDFVRRQQEFRNATYKKISHVCNDANRSMNHMKRSEHLKMILDYPRDLNLYDKIILSTDQEQSNIYVYQSSKITGENKIQIFSFANNIAQSQKMKTLPRQVQSIIQDEDKCLNKRPSSKRFQADNRSYYLNSKFKNLVSSNTHIKTRFDDAQDLGEMVRPQYDIMQEQEVVQYRSNQMTHRISHADEQRFAVVEGKSGKYLNIRIKQDHNKESITFQMYTRNNTHYLFCFTINTMGDMKKTYFFVKKTIKDVEELGTDNHQSLITFQDDQKIHVVMCNDLKGTKKQILAKYLTTMTFKQLQDKLNGSDQILDQLDQVEKNKSPSKNSKDVDGKVSPYQLSLQFEALYDMSSSIDFLPFIYQDKEKIESHNLLVMDIDKMQIVQKTCINANLTLRKTIRKTECGFSVYTLTRTSDVFNQKQGYFISHTGSGDASHQIVKYQVGSQYFIVNPDEKNPAACTIEFSEYCVKFSNFEKNQIVLIGRKQLLLSDFAIKARTASFENFCIIPWWDNQNNIKGSQFILKEDENVITLKDQDENNHYHQKSQLVAFGHQKFLTNQDNHDEYILIASCQFRQNVYMKGNFENNEAYYIMNKIQKKLLSQQLAKFEYFVLNDDFDALMREEFYQPQEVLQGKSIFDLCLGFPKEVANGLKQEKAVYKKIDGSLISEICNYDDKILKFFVDAKLCEENLMVQIDFNFVSSLRLAMELNSNQAVKLMLNNVFEINSIEYQEMMMLDFPKFLDQQNIKRIYPFLERDHEEYLRIQKDQDEVYTVKNKKRNQFCNFEEFMSHPKLPPFGTEQKSFHIKEHFQDFHSSEQEMVQEMINKDPYMAWGVKNFGSDGNTESKVFEHKNVEVEHSLIDFQKIIIGEKIRDVQEDGFHTVNFNDQHLASIFCVEPDSQVDFYNLETVRKIVDFQFITTKWFVQWMFRFYLGGFMIPFLISLSAESKLVLNVSYTMCLFTQIFFFMFELVQLKEQRLAYFTDMWNIIDTSQFAIFVLLYIIKMISQFSNDTVFEIFMQGILLYQCFYKVFYFIRIYDSMAFILTLMTNICYEALPFGGFMMGMLIGFVKFYALFHVGYDKESIQPGINDGNQDDQIHFDLVKRAMIVYMNVAGDITAPILEQEMWDRLKDTNLFLFLFFAFVIFMWASQAMLFGVSGTFFISMVWQSYEKQYRLFPMYHYKIKARYNEENFQILDMFQKARNFKVIFFSFDKEYKSIEETQWLGVSNSIMKFQIYQDQCKKQQDKKSNAKRDEIANTQIQTDKNVSESLGLIRHLALENQELKQRVAELSRNLGYEQK